MRQPRVFVERDLESGLQFRPEIETRRYLSSVLRLRSGATLRLFNGRGGEFEARLEQRNGELELIVGNHHAAESESPLSVTLLQGISRGERMDWTLQKSVELGVERIIPLMTQRCAVQLDQERRDRRRRRWQEILVHAAEQCGRNRIPQLEPITSLADSLVLDRGWDARWVLEPDGDEEQLDRSLTPQRIALLIGPEGGLDREELALARAHGFNSLRLGPRVLRTETAGVVALSVVQWLWGDLG